jgi:hypothetical protein
LPERKPAPGPGPGDDKPGVNAFPPPGRRDGFNWHPVCLIEKYSPDQVSFARRYFSGYLSGDALRGLFIGSGPECGTVRDEGNKVTDAGRANLVALLTSTGGHPLAEGRMVFGVGTDPAGFDSGHVHLANATGEEPGTSFYRPMDASYPRVAPGMVEGQATFSEAEACFDWREWCWGTGAPGPMAHHSLRGAYGGLVPVMLNRKAAPGGYGVKEPGVAWVFRTQVTLL